MEIPFEEKPTEDRETGKTVPEARISRPEIHERDECNTCGIPYESDQSCNECKRNPVKQAYLKNLGKNHDKERR